MEKGEVVIDPQVLARLGAKPTPYMPIERQPDPMGLAQGSIEKALSPTAAEKVYSSEMRLKIPGSGS